MVQGTIISIYYYPYIPYASEFIIIISLDFLGHFSFRDGNEARWVQRMRSSPLPCMILSYPIPTLPCMTWKFFLPHLRPLEPHKTLILVNFSTTITVVFNKTYFVNKNILEIAKKFILSNQTNFSKN